MIANTNLNNVERINNEKMKLSEIVTQILKITNESTYGRLGMDSVEAGEIWKLLNKELKQSENVVLDSVSKCINPEADIEKICHKCGIHLSEHPRK